MSEVGNDGPMDSSPMQKCHASLKTSIRDLSWSPGDVSLLSSDRASEGMFCSLELIISNSLPPFRHHHHQRFVPRARIQTRHPVCHPIIPVTQDLELSEATWKVLRRSKSILLLPRPVGLWILQLPVSEAGTVTH